MDLELLQYDILYGKQYVYGGTSPYQRVKLHLGVKDTVLDKIEKISDGRYYVTGENFTQSAYVEINEELVDATFISPTTLLLSDVELKDGDKCGNSKQQFHQKGSYQNCKADLSRRDQTGY